MTIPTTSAAKLIYCLILFFTFYLNEGVAQSYDDSISDVLKEYRAGNYDESLKLINSIIDTLDETNHKRQVDSRYIQISIYCYLDDYDQARPSFDYLNARTFSNDTIESKRLDVLSYYKFSSKDYDTAIPSYNVAFDQYLKIKNYDKAVKMLSMRAMCEGHLNQKETSVNTLIYADSLLNSVDVHPKLIRSRKFQILNELGNAAYFGLDLEKAKSIFLRALDIDSISIRNRSSVKGNLIDCYLKLEEYDRCIAMAKELVDDKRVKFSTRIYAYSDLIESHCKQGNLDIARRALNDLSTIHNDTTSAYYQNNFKRIRGIYYTHTGEYDKAIATLRQAYNYVVENQSEKKNTRHSLAESIVKAHSKKFNSRTFNRDFENYLSAIDTIQYWNNKNEILDAVTKYETRVKEDSIQLLNYELENKRIQAKNSRLFSLSVFLGLLASFLALWQLQARLKRQREANERLIFEKEELEELNASLAGRVDSLETSKSTSDIVLLKIKSNDKIYNIETPHISHIVAEDNGCRIHYENKSIWTDRALKSLDEELNERGFVRVHRSSIVNIIHVEWVNHASLMLKNKELISIGRSYKQQIRIALKEM